MPAKPMPKNNGSKKNKNKVVTKQMVTRLYNKLAPSKEFRTVFTALMATSSGVLGRTAMSDLTVIVQGTQMNQRLQNSINVSYVHIKGEIGNNDTKTKFLRMILVRQKHIEPLNLVTYENLLLDSTFNHTAPAGTGIDGRASINTEILQIYFDKKYKLLPESEGGRAVDEKIRVSQLLDYGFTNPVSGSPLNGALRLIAILYEADATVSAATVNMTLQTRIFYKDAGKLPNKIHN